MADNYITNPGAGGITFAGDEDGALAQWPLIKLAWGQLDTFNILADAAGKRLPINLAECGITLNVAGPLTDAQLRASAVPVSGAFFQATQPVSIAATVTVSGTVTTTPPANASTNLALVGGVAISEGQKAMAASLPVVIASDQSAVPVSGTVTTSPPANASTNVAQFGGTNVATGTGVGGAGIPRVTVSSDSFPATQAVSGTVTANQGTANTAANAWPVKTTDGTNVAAVKAASTAAVAADPALVVAISPNNVPPVLLSASISSNNTSAVALGANVTFTGVQDLGETWAEFGVSCFANVPGTLQAQWSSDGANWDLTQTFPYSTPGVMMTLNLPSRTRRFRVVYINGGVAQTAFRLQTILRQVAVAGDVTALRDAAQPHMIATATRAQLIGQNDASASAFASATIKAALAPAGQSDTSLVVQENSGSLQRVADLLEAILSEVQVHSVYLSQLCGGGDDPNSLRDSSQILN